MFAALCQNPEGLSLAEIHAWLHQQPQWRTLVGPTPNRQWIKRLRESLKPILPLGEPFYPELHRPTRRYRIPSARSVQIVGPVSQ